MPRVLFSAPECRAIVIDLQTGEAMGNHHVRERAVVQVETPQGIRESAPGRYEIAAAALPPGRQRSRFPRPRWAILPLL